ncbi:MAG: hypothetical protein V7707_08165 [Motiliproteus sp.]
MKAFYGLTEPTHAVDIATQVCDLLGHGKNNRAVHLLLETAAQETHLGQYRDGTDYRAGFGLCQVDEIGFVDVVQRTRSKNKALLKEQFDIDLDLVAHRELEHSPLLSMVICRLHYKLKPEVVPVDLADRAAYWKKHYNTVAGKGEPVEFIDNAQHYIAPLLGSY